MVHSIGVVIIGLGCFMNCLSLSIHPMVVEKYQLPKGTHCTDATGVRKGHNEDWTSSADSCDKNICHVSLFNYVVTQSCVPLTDNDIPDIVNCREVSDSSQPFPGCCPVVQCDDAAPRTTISPLVCRDRSSNYACSVWKDLTNGCVTGVLESIYNITKKFCRHSCSYC